MNRALLGPTITAVSLALAAPAAAQGFVAGSFTGSSGVRDFAFAAPSAASVRVHRGWAGRGHRRIGYGYGYGYYPGGYDDPGDYDANRSFDPDKWNDWWHERPERAFPRWMSRNRDCSRQWYSGDVLTC